MQGLKQIGTICLLIFSFIFPSFATDPDISANTTSASCDSDVLNSDNGPVDIEINWEPNDINVRWYSNNTLMTTNTCTYDGSLTMPDTIPQREGYTFTGWRVRPMMDFSAIPTNNFGTKSWSKGWWGNANCCNGGTVECNTDPIFAELQTYEWKVRFEHGYLYGMSKCSTEGEGLDQGMVGNSTINSTVGQYCWCKATGYKPNNSDTVYSPSNEMLWVWRNNLPNNCLQNCASHCAYAIRDWPAFHRKIVNAIAN